MDQPKRQLKEFWYQKLKEEGFKDIEDVNSKHEFLIDWHSIHFQFKFTPQEFLERQRYFQMSREFLITHKFKNKRDKIIWALHSEGHSIREIANLIDMYKSGVGDIIVHLTKEMLGR